jgi:small nuclear ribonucleoprotein (snRNP)-like protein
MSCFKRCQETNTICPKDSCRYWLDFEEDLNCTLVAVDKHGNMTLREIAKRLSLSFVRVKQIQDSALQKLNLKIRNMN